MDIYLNEPLIMNSSINVDYIHLEIKSKENLRKFLKGKSGIYCWYCTKSKLVYIGSAVCLWRRFLSYLNSFKNKDGKNNIRLTRKVQKYGILNIKFAVLEYCFNDKKLLKEKEQFLLDRLTPFGELGFNVSKSALRPLNCEISKKGRKKISETHTGENSKMSKLKDDDVFLIKKRLSEGCSLRILSEEFKVSTTVISNIKRGKSWTHIKNEEAKLKRCSKKDKRKNSKEKIQEISNRIKSGERLIDLSNEYKIPYPTIACIKYRHCK